MGKVSTRIIIMLNHQIRDLLFHYNYKSKFGLFSLAILLLSRLLSVFIFALFYSVITCDILRVLMT